ncbi:MAG: tetratricopeptide repeat protein [Deferribacterales bacterium]
MRKWIFLIIAIALAAGGLYYTYSDISYQYYEDAKKLYDEGKYVEAHDMLEEGLRKNPLNRKIIALKGKVYPIVQGNEDYKEAEALYQEAVNLALEGKVSAAKLKMSKAYELAGKVTSTSLVKDKADELIKKIERDSTLVLDSAAETQYKNALKQEADGNLLRAYEGLNNIEVKNEKIRRKMSDIAFRLGEMRYREIKSSGDANEHYVRDSLYWFSLVQPFDDRYTTAAERINELKLTKTN